jgi:hypothetical protein
VYILHKQEYNIPICRQNQLGTNYGLQGEGVADNHVEGNHYLGAFLISFRHDRRSLPSVGDARCSFPHSVQAMRCPRFFIALPERGSVDVKRIRSESGGYERLHNSIVSS